jgi:hypothetical protein
MFPQYGYVNCITIDPDNADHALAVFSNYNVVSLFRTTDGGISWSAVAGNLEEKQDGSGNGPSCQWAELVKRPEGIVYLVGTSTGLYSTAEMNGNATVWTREGSTTIGSSVVDMIKVRQSDGLVVVATHGNGIFSAYARVSGVDDGAGHVHAELRLEQNVPNPARGSTSIRFQVPAFNGAPIPVHLGLFDARGAEVATLAHAPLPPGAHTVPYDCSALPAGTYFYRLSVGRATAIRTMVVTR